MNEGVGGNTYSSSCSLLPLNSNLKRKEKVGLGERLRVERAPRPIRDRGGASETVQLWRVESRDMPPLASCDGRLDPPEYHAPART